jgi:hypothetical protein
MSHQADLLVSTKALPYVQARTSKYACSSNSILFANSPDEMSLLAISSVQVWKPAVKNSRPQPPLQPAPLFCQALGGSAPASSITPRRTLIFSLLHTGVPDGLSLHRELPALRSHVADLSCLLTQLPSRLPCLPNHFRPHPLQDCLPSFRLHHLHHPYRCRRFPRH